MLKALLKILQLDFIDGQIKSRIKSSLEEIYGIQSRMKDIDSYGIGRLFDLESTVRDSLDDIRLLVLENIKREYALQEEGSGDAILSARKLCGDPIVKVVSTKETIQKSFTDSTNVVTEEREKQERIIDECNLSTLRGALLESDVLKVLNFPDNCPEPVTMAVSIATETENSRLFEFNVVFKSAEDWEVIPAELQEGYIQFPLRPTKHIYVISTEKWELHRLTPDGLHYKSADFEDLTITFPPGCVRKECEIEIQVMPPNKVELTERHNRDDFTDIVIVSPRLWVKHDGKLRFQKPIVVTLPLLPSTDEDTELCLFKWTDSEEVYISETKLLVNETFCEFTVVDFSGFCTGKRTCKKKSKKKNNIIGRDKSERGMPKDCNILIFSDRTVDCTLWVEIVECKKKNELLEERSKNELVPIANCESTSLTIRYGQNLSISASGNICITDHFDKEYLHIEFTYKDESNRIRFDVNILGATDKAILIFHLENEKVHVCSFNAYRWLKQQNATSQPKPNQPGIFKDKVLCLQSLNVLAEQIPCDQVMALGIELNISTNEVNNLKKHGNKGFELTLQTLILWRNRCHEQETDMIKELASALNQLSLKMLASKVLEASKANRFLKREEFQEQKC